jgi:DNA-damage-inducible protein J
MVGVQATNSHLRHHGLSWTNSLVMHYIVATYDPNLGDEAMSTDAVVRARIDGEVKEKAAIVLAEMGLSVSDAIRMMLVRVAAEKALPFKVRVPNAKTEAAFRESDRDEGITRAKDAADMLGKLGI